MLIDRYKAKLIFGFSALEKIEESDLKRRYKKLIIKLHPDKNIAQDTNERCQELNEAYQYLLDFPNSPEILTRKMDNKETFDAKSWNITRVGQNVFMSHPKFIGCKPDISYFGRQSVFTLPIDNFAVKRALIETIPPLLEQKYGLGGLGVSADDFDVMGEVEGTIRMPKDETRRKQIMKAIAAIYNMPFDLWELIDNQLETPSRKQRLD